ncbi:MAG TPA: hypothetical protein VFL81_00780 [Candidatus Saccharimonadales bacterium]|nr:hypothetical protein [Candidatus Saccharimonadales bacterium]
MSEHKISKEKVIFTASALGATAALGAVAYKLIKRHLENGDEVILEGVSQEVAEELGVHRVEATSEPLSGAEVAYVGIDDDEFRAESAEEVSAIGEESAYKALTRRVIGGAVYLRNLGNKS